MDGYRAQVDELVDAVTFGNVPQVKTVLASVATSLAVYQVFLMGVGYRKVRLEAVQPRAASFAHRSLGDVIVPITLLMAWMCLAYFGVGDGIEHAAYGETTRATLHVVAGSALIAVLVLKIVVVRWWRSMQRFLPHLGISVLVLFLITWATSAGDYLLGGQS